MICAIFSATRASSSTSSPSCGRLVISREVADLGVVGLAVAVDAADALLESVGVERDVEVDQPVTVVAAGRCLRRLRRWRAGSAASPGRGLC